MLCSKSIISPWRTLWDCIFFSFMRVHAPRGSVRSCCHFSRPQELEKRPAVSILSLVNWKGKRSPFHLLRGRCLDSSPTPFLPVTPGGGLEIQWNIVSATVRLKWEEKKLQANVYFRGRQKLHSGFPCVQQTAHNQIPSLERKLAILCRLLFWFVLDD